jgi:hypothetical protein
LLSSSGTANRTSPHGCVDEGMKPEPMIFSAAGLICDGLIRLLTNGARSAICLPVLHCGDAASVKSPASIAAVGTNARLSLAICRARVRW